MLSEPDREQQDEEAVPPPCRGTFHAILREGLGQVVDTLVEEVGPDATKAEIEDVAARAKAITEDIVKSVVPQWVRSMTTALVETETSSGSSARKGRAAFREEVRSMWGTAFDGLDLLIGVFYEAGRDALTDAARDGRLASDTRLRVLFDLHARSCRTANEILVLLEAGHADGALARCRTLHEIAVVAEVLSTHDETLAKRYAEHAVVRTLDLVDEFHAHREVLKWEPIPETERATLAAHVDALIERYGKRFAHQYGWADGVIPPTVAGQKVGLHDLERAAGLAHFRPFGSWASASVHAGAQGLRSLGIPRVASEFSTGPFLYAAGSTSGLADPGQHVALSLGHVAGALAPHLLILDGQVQIGVIAKLVDRCQAAFLAAGEAVDALTRRNLSVQRSTGDSLASE